MDQEGTLAHPDLPTAAWRKSTRSGSNDANCVEVASLTGAVALRDSKDPAGPALIFASRDWDAFIAGTKHGTFDR